MHKNARAFKAHAFIAHGVGYVKKKARAFISHAMHIKARDMKKKSTGRKNRAFFGKSARRNCSQVQTSSLLPTAVSQPERLPGFER